MRKWQRVEKSEHTSTDHVLRHKPPTKNKARYIRISVCLLSGGGRERGATLGWLSCLVILWVGNAYLGGWEVVCLWRELISSSLHNTPASSPSTLNLQMVSKNIARWGGCGGGGTMIFQCSCIMWDWEMNHNEENLLILHLARTFVQSDEEKVLWSLLHRLLTFTPTQRLWVELCISLWFILGSKLSCNRVTHSKEMKKSIVIFF